MSEKVVKRRMKITRKRSPARKIIFYVSPILKLSPEGWQPGYKTEKDKKIAEKERLNSFTLSEEKIYPLSGQVKESAIKGKQIEKGGKNKEKSFFLLRFLDPRKKEFPGQDTNKSREGVHTKLLRVVNMKRIDG